MKNNFYILISVLLIATNCYAQVDLLNGLVAYYPFNGNTNDESGNGYNGTIIGEAGLSNDANGNLSAISFSGINSYISYDWDGQIDNGSGSFSLALWFKTNKAGETIIRNGLNGPSSGYLIQLASNNTLTFGLGGSGNYNTCVGIETSTTGFNDNKWRFITVVLDRSSQTVKYFINGEQVKIVKSSISPYGGTVINDNYDYDFSSLSNLSTAATLPFTLGSAGGGSEYFSGSLDNVRIYNRAINIDEIQALYTEGCTNYFTQSPTISTLSGNTLSVTTYPGAAYQWGLNSNAIGNGSTINNITTSGLYTVTITNVACIASASYNYTYAPANTADGVNLSSGLIAYYPFNGNTNDESGNGNNASFFGENIYGTGISNLIGSCASFTGSNYLNINTIVGNFGLGDFTITTWINTSDLSNINTAQRIFAKRKSTDYDEPFISLSIDNITDNVVWELSQGNYIYNNSDGITKATTIKIDTWYYLTFIRKQNVVFVYINGVVDGSKTVTPLNCDNNFISQIGVYTDGIGGVNNHFFGRMDEYRIYNRALNNSEIQALYAEGCNTYFAQSPTITTLSGNSLSVTTYPGAIYQWTLNTNSIGSSSTISNATTSGLYTVTVTNVACIASISYNYIYTPVNTTGGVDLSNSLAAYYPFNGNANDESGNANNGTVTGALLFNDRFGNPNQCYTFSGANDNLIDAGNNLSLGHSSFTLSAWFKTSQIATGTNKGQRIISKGATDSNKGFVLGVNYNTSGVISFAAGSSDSPDPSMTFFISTINNSYNNNTWHNAIVIVDNENNKARIYVDGILQDIAKVTSGINGGTITGKELDISGLNIDVTTPDHLSFGKLPENSNENFVGNIDEIRIYNRVVSEAEIQSLYTEGCINYFTQSPTISTLSGNTLSVTTYPGAAYQWALNSNAIGNGSTINNIITSGLYTVTITNVACVTTTSYNYATITNSGTDLSNGLVASYPFCGNAYDVSGNGNNGTIFGATFATDRFGNLYNALSVSGTNFISTSYAGVEGSNPRTISLWIKPDGSKQSQSILFWYGRGGLDAKNNSLFFGQQFSGRINYSTASDLGMDLNASAIAKVDNNVDLYDGNWHHLVYLLQTTQNANLNNIKMYIDGNEITTISSSINTSMIIDTKLYPMTSAYNFTLGYPYISNYNYNGLLDDVLFFDRDLSNIEILALYNAVAPCTSSGCDLYSSQTPVVTINNNELITTIITGDTYQWYLNNSPIISATGNTLTNQLQIGIYYAQSLLGGCSNNSLPFYVGTTLSPIISVVTVTNYKIIYVDENGNTIAGIDEGLKGSRLDESRLQGFYSDDQSLDLSNGLVAYYPFNGNANDISGNGYNLSLTGASTLLSPILTTDRHGNSNASYQFGPDMKAFATPISDFNSISVSQWFTVPNATYGSFYPTFFDFYSDPNNSSDSFITIHHFKHYAPDDYPDAISTSVNANGLSLQTNIFTPNGILTNNQWYHLGVTYNQTTLEVNIYLNGSLVGSNIASYAHEAFSYLNIGSSHPIKYNTTADFTTDRLASYFTGKLDDIRVYNRVLSETEIQSLYTGDCKTYSAQSPTISINNNQLTTIPVEGAAYQWYLNGSALTGATSNTLADQLQVGTYTLKESFSSCDNVVSQPFYIGPNPPSIISVVTITVYKIVHVDENGNTVTGINDHLKKSEISVYPNPSKGTITVQSENTNIAKVEILNTLGIKIYETSILKDINLSGYANGVYIVKLYNNENDIIKITKVLLE